ncbi:MAG: hypothetical protein NTV63_02080, partial [Candidatus Woesearchaeota archaeon]|nr:hypothetical protein [Candidatus Woesearchaeota archaeon]
FASSSSSSSWNIEEPEKTALFFTLFIMASYFFMELQLSFYIDLTYSLLCALFMIYLTIFNEDCTKNNITLAIIIFLMMMAKNTSYILLPIFFATSAIYFLATKKEKKWQYLKRIGIVFLGGIFLYFLIGTGLSIGKIDRDIGFGYTGSMMREIDHVSGISKKIAYYAKTIIEKPIIPNNYMFIKFNSVWLSLLVYLSAAYFAIMKKNWFMISLFITGEVFLFIFFNIIGYDHALRYILPFYFIYLYFFYILAKDILDRTFKKKKWIIAVGIILILGIFNMVQLNNNLKRLSHPYLWPIFLAKLVPEDIKGYPGIYATKGNPFNEYVSSIIDIDMKIMAREGSISVKSLRDNLCLVEKRFCYNIIGQNYNMEENPDYAITFDLETLPFNYSIINEIEYPGNSKGYFVKVVSG